MQTNTWPFLGKNLDDINVNGLVSDERDGQEIQILAARMFNQRMKMITNKLTNLIINN